jgi:hypothetical protein
MSNDFTLIIQPIAKEEEDDNDVIVGLVMDRAKGSVTGTCTL